ncbi:MAG: hypothetical protein NTX33_09495 [Propionibacteriales bacterium]|nr:hypothetical protein [Propionibacteriales bacterium]
MAKLRVHQIEDDLRALWEYAPLATRDLAEKGPTLHRALMVALRLHPERVFGLHGVDRRFEAFAHANGKEHRRSARRWA